MSDGGGPVDFIIDASFGHASITPAALRKIGAAGAILYAGCADTRKNATAAEVGALLDAGFSVGLVIENTAQGMLGGHAAGVTMGKAIAAGAQAVGYDPACVLFTAADWNVSAAQEPTVDAFMTGFGSVVECPGLYSNSYALDYCAARGHARSFWQSDSASFSDGISANAHLSQNYNDPRAQGLPLDVNDIYRLPIGLMGENMTTVDLTPASIAAIAKAVGVEITAAVTTINAQTDHDSGLLLFGDSADAAAGKVPQGHPYNLTQLSAAVAALGGSLPTAVAQAVVAAEGSGPNGSLTVADVEHAVETVLAGTVLKPASTS